MGRCVYRASSSPAIRAPVSDGLRNDVLELTRELGVSLVRYPGGNFVSGYRWEDGVGPVNERPTRLDLAWRSIEPNTFGLHEFMGWAAAGRRGADAGGQPGYPGRPGGGRPASSTPTSPAARCCRIGGSRTAPADPFGIKLWCLGNEMDGPWQIGHKTAAEYGRLAAETAKAMRLVDPRSSWWRAAAPTGRCPPCGLGSDRARAHLRARRLHLHARLLRGDRQPGRGSSPPGVDMDGFIEDVVATADHVRRQAVAAPSSSRFLRRVERLVPGALPDAPNAEWQHAPRLIEDDYTVADAVVSGRYLISLLNHADRVSVACQAQLANVIAPIRTEPGGPAWRQTIFYPFAHAARLARGLALQLPITSPSVAAPRYGLVPAVARGSHLGSGYRRGRPFSWSTATRTSSHSVSVDVSGARTGRIECAVHRSRRQRCAGRQHRRTAGARHPVPPTSTATRSGSAQRHPACGQLDRTWR